MQNVKSIQGEEIPLFMPIVDDLELKKQILTLIKQDRKMIFKLEKFTYSDTLGPNNSLKRRKQMKGTK
jgi:5-bromo-4-chloroindolyl phosphate hydrolysis protein